MRWSSFFTDICWLTTCISFLFLLIFWAGWVSKKVMINCKLTRNDFLYICKLIIILFSIHRLILYLFGCLSRLFSLHYRKWYVCGCFYCSLSLCMFVKWSLIYIQFIDWIYTFVYLYVVSFHLNYCSVYVIGCLTRSHYFAWLWNNFCLISSSLIDSLLRSECYFYLF